MPRSTSTSSSSPRRRLAWATVAAGLGVMALSTPARANEELKSAVANFMEQVVSVLNADMVQANATNTNTNTNTNTSGAGRRLASFPPWGDGEGWPENWTAPWSSSGDAGAAPTTSWDVTNWLPTEMQETYAEWLSTAGDMVDEMQHEGSISFPAAQKLQDIQYKMELIESAEHPEEVFYALVQDAIQEVCDPAAIIVGALVGVEDFQDDVRGDPDKVITVGDVVGERCEDSPVACGKVLAEIYQGLVLPYCVGAEFRVEYRNVLCEAVPEVVTTPGPVHGHPLPTVVGGDAVCVPAQLWIVKNPAYCVHPIKPVLTYLGKDCRLEKEIGPDVDKTIGGDVYLFDIKELGSLPMSYFDQDRY